MNALKVERQDYNYLKFKIPGVDLKIGDLTFTEMASKLFQFESKIINKEPARIELQKMINFCTLSKSESRKGPSIGPKKLDKILADAVNHIITKHPKIMKKEKGAAHHAANLK
eukprot:12408035-Karenia_brevis.AAC.1